MRSPRDILTAFDPKAWTCVSDDVFDLATDYAKLNVGESQYGANYEQALAFWVGHFLTIATAENAESETSGSATDLKKFGDVSELRVGEVAVSYQAAMKNASITGFGTSEDWLSQTKWGVLLKGLAMQFTGLSMFVT